MRINSNTTVKFLTNIVWQYCIGSDANVLTKWRRKIPQSQSFGRMGTFVDKSTRIGERGESVRTDASLS